MAGPLEHLDVVVRVAEGGCVSLRDAEVRAEPREARALIDALVHDVDPDRAAAGDREALAEGGDEHLVAHGHGVALGEVDRVLVCLAPEALERLDVDDLVVELAEDLVVAAGVLGHVAGVEPADDRHAVRALAREGEQGLEVGRVDQALEHDLAAAHDRRAVVGDERHALVRDGEEVAQRVEGTPARGGERDADTLELSDALVHPLGHGLVVGEQREVHVACHEPDVGEVGVHLVSEHASPFVLVCGTILA